MQRTSVACDVRSGRDSHLFGTLRFLAVISVALPMITACTAGGAAREATAQADPVASEGEYIPVDLEDAIRVLERDLSPGHLAFIRDSLSEDMSRLHFGLGLGLRNKWGLWAGSRLATYFQSIAITHPDDMSAIILNSLWRRIHGRPLRLGEQVAFHQRYWAVTAPPKDSVFRECPGGVRRHNVTQFRRDTTWAARHFGQCIASGEWWAYELDRGWFVPDSASLAHALSP